MFGRRTIDMAAAIAASFASLTAAAPTPANVTTTEVANWKPCQSPLPNNIDCADINVPLDYDNPNDETISLKLLRLPAVKKKEGTLVFQYGGPGVVTSNSIFLEAANSSLRAFYGLEESFDIVVADPRGVGINHPVKCDSRFDSMKFDYFPTNEKEYEETLAIFREMGASCHKRMGRVMEFMDTMTQARDLDAVRIAIGEGGLNYYGVSWGTFRGQLYAETYPDNVRSMILDGVMDHSVSTSQIYASQSATYSMSQRRMFEWMSKSSDSSLQGRDVGELWRELIGKADKSPLPVPECEKSGLCFGEVSGADLRLVPFTPANDPEIYWQAYSELFRDAFDNGNYTALSQKYPSEDDPIQGYGSQFAIACQDWGWEPSSSWAGYQTLQYMATSMSLDPQSVFGARTWALACPVWPTKVTNPPRELNVTTTKNPIMFIHALWDPATGYDAAVAVQRRFPGSYFLTRYGEGHGSYNYPEVVEAWIEYLIDPGSVDPKTAPLIGEPMSPMLTDFEMMGWSE